MLRKTLKIAMVIFMLLGIAFSISNFTTDVLDADATRAIRGAYVYYGGAFRCMTDGNDCIIKP